MGSALRALWESAGHQALLLILVAGILVLGLLVIGFSAFAVVLRARNTRHERRWAVLEERWEAAVLEALEGTRSAASVRALVPRRDALWFVEFVSRFARRLRGTEREVLGEMVAPFLRRLSDRLRHPDEAVRARAVQTLSLLAFGAHAGRLVRALDDASPLVAMAAARALTHREHPEFAPQVLRRLSRFTRWRPSFVSAMLTGMGPDAVPELLATFGDPAQTAEARAIVADALRVLHVLEAADIAVDLLGPQRNRELVAAALRLLRDLGRREHVGAVRALLTSADDLVRKEAIGAFGALAAPDELEVLLPALEDRSPWAALEAARALRPLRDGAALRALAGRNHPHAPIAAEVLAEDAR